MTLSLYLGRVFGIYFIIAGFLYLFRRDFLRKAAFQIFEMESLLVLTGLINILIGLLVILGHPVWVMHWETAITLLGYLILLKGLIRLFISQRIDKKIALKMIKGDNLIYLGIICLIIGFFLTYEGFFGSL